MMRMLTIALAFALACPTPALAHKLWLLPSQTVLSGTDPWVTVDAAVSNDIFYFNHHPLRLDGLVITAPDGTGAQAENESTGKYRSVFDLPLQQQGTYRIAVLNSGLFASWMENGQPKRWRGTAESFATEVPAGAEQLQVSESLGRIETFVTNGAPTDTALKATGKGIELFPLTHPNDLYAGEETGFRLTVDGQPQEGIEIEIIRSGTRYRNALEEITVTTDANGEFTVVWPEPGMYQMEATTQDDKTQIPEAQTRRLSYAATLEVLPQ